MFNLGNLNDYEFELLAKDIMERLLNIELFTFSRGKDLGIDICNSTINPEVVIQVKHYSKSSFSDLLRSMKKEINHINSHNPNNYYLVTSMELTRQNKINLVSLFPNYMKDISFIIDKIMINAFLSKNTNEDIINRHYKLWLSSSNVLNLVYNQNVFIDCESFLYDVEKESSTFVETDSYKEAMNILNKNNIVIITGGPGVGKTTLSKMLVLNYAANDYQIRFTTNNNISDIKNVLSRERDKKELILLDDFLGQHYLKLSEDQPNEIKSLISFIKRSSSKLLILNSRITIINEARRRFINFNDLMSNNKENNLTIDLDKMSKYEKAKILYNHLYQSSIPPDFYSEIKKDKNYLNIVSHKNYNPRIVEYLTKPAQYKKLSPTNYVPYFLNKLDFPNDVWQDEFDNRLSEEDRILANTLYSLTDTSINKKYLEKAFNNRIRNIKFDSSLNQFQIALKRLTNSVFKLITDKGEILISPINPSVNDYLKDSLKSNPNEQIEIIKNAIYVEQVVKVPKNDESEHYIKKLLKDKDFFLMKTLENSPFYYYLSLIYDYSIFDKDIANFVQLSFSRIDENLNSSKSSEYSSLVLSLIKEDFFDYYELYKIIDEDIISYNILEPLDYQTLIDAFQVLNEKGIELCMLNLNSLLIEKTLDYVSDYGDDKLYDIVYNFTDSYEVFDEEDISSIIDSIWESLEQVLLDETIQLMEKYNLIYKELSISISNLDLADLKFYFDIEGAVRDIIKDDESSFFEDYLKKQKEEESLISEIFER